GEGSTPGQIAGDAWAYKFPDQPTITIPPQNVSVAEGRMAQFHVGVFTQTPQRRYAWYHDGVRVSGDDGDRISGNPCGFLSIDNVKPSDAGMYSCDVSNECGLRTTA